MTATEALTRAQPAFQAPTLSSHRQIQSVWPLTALLVGFPVWWAVGLGAAALPIVAVPMAMSLWRLDKIKVPPALGWWLLFLIWVCASGVMLGLTAPDTLPGTFAGRVPAFVLRLGNYLAATVVMLFVVNLGGRLSPVSRIVRMQAWFFIVVVIGGLSSIFFPRFSFPSVVELLLPPSLSSNRYLTFLIHPQLAQLQDVLGYEAPRPAAPFPYTNTWGNCISILLVWFAIALWCNRSSRSRLLCVAVVVVALVPVIYSLNRGLWLGLIVSFAYLAIRAGFHGRTRLLVGCVIGSFLACISLASSPLFGLIQDRLANPHSNEARFNTSTAAITAAASSPILGYGSTRALLGSDKSIAVGRSADCPQCGNAAIGGAGQLWLLLIAQGFVGAFLYLGFFAKTMWTYRRERHPVFVGGVLILALSFVYLPVYGAEGIPLALYLLAAGLMARQKDEEQTVSAVPEAPDPSPTMGGRLACTT